VVLSGEWSVVRVIMRGHSGQDLSFVPQFVHRTNPVVIGDVQYRSKSEYRDTE
jgi:hypothetical protein